MSWIPLHLHSQYTVLGSSASIDALVGKAAALAIPALALTDQGNLYGAVEFFKACKGAKIKPIIGCELAVAPGSRHDKKRIPGVPAGCPIVLLVKNAKGYENLCRLSSMAFLEGFYYTPRIDKALLEECSEGLICLSGGHGSPFAYQILQSGDVGAEISWYHQLFGEDFYFELMRHSMEAQTIEEDGLLQETWLHQRYTDYIREQDKINEELLFFSKKLGIPCVATNGTRYIEREDWRAHEILLNIQSGEPCEICERDSFGRVKQRAPNPKRETFPTHELYFKSPEQMEILFADQPDALANTCKVAEKCQFEFDLKARFYPVFVPPALEGKNFTKEERSAAAENYLRQLCEEGIPVRYTPERLAAVEKKYPDRDPMAVVKERLNYELDVILPKGMGDYLLIVWDFIAWAKRRGIPMGPGRGSGAGSIVLYLIGITDIEPLRFNLFFERFINPERISYPDIDVDICMDRRSEVIDYTVSKYGKDKVAQIITFGTMKAKMAIRDVGRVLNIPLSRVNEIVKLVPEELNITLAKALETDPELKRLCESDPDVGRLISLATKLEGSVRNTGIHAAGMIISGDPLIERIPVCMAKDSEMAVTQFSMKPVEAVGMLKIDFLGLKTLTAVQQAVDEIKRTTGKEIDWVNLPLDDAETFNLLNQGKTMGIFQLESGGMQDLVKQLHVDRFEEVIAVGALYRPGPMEMIPSFINRKHKREPIEFEHPFMADILSETYGIMVYQEQVMQIASRLAGYTLGEGDVLRRAMGKKDREEMNRQREKFVRGAQQNGITEQLAIQIFDKVEKFASYGFNKSHAAAYAYLSYVTAYLKAHYPGEWMAALMSSDRDDLSKVAKVIRESQAMGIPVLPPDINESGKEFVAASKGIRFAMGGIKGVGEGVVETIVAERDKGGDFRSLYDFIQRIDTRKVGKKTIECLIESGCFDETGWSRPSLLLSVDPMFLAATREQKEKAQGILNLFSLIDDPDKERFSKPPLVTEKVPKQHTLKREYELLGFYLNGHPLDDFRPQLQRLSCVPLKELENLPPDSVCRIAFIIEGVVVRISAKTQRKFAILTIGDGIDHFELPVWADLYEQKGTLLVENQLLYAVVQTEKQGDELKIQSRWLGDLTRIDEEMIKACDDAYVKAKEQVKMNALREKKWEKKETPPVKKKNEKIILKLNADKTRLSHILQLKELFRSHSGETPIQIEFLVSGSAKNSLLIDESWGITVSQQLEEKILKIPSVDAYLVSHPTVYLQ